MGLIQNKVTVSQPNSHVVVKNAGGLRGLTGETGQQGPQGVPGEAATVTAGTTTTLPAGSNATVQNVGSTSAAIFNFGIPKGDKGDTGESGAAATIYVGSTSTLPAGSSATVTNSGTSSAAVFDFGIPKGDKGDTGATGADGYSPSATVTKTGDTATITITDKDGTTTASISDGTTPTVNDGTLKIQKNGTTVQTFSADQASNVTANITVPTQFSELSGTVSSSQIEDEAITTGSVSGTGTNITLSGTMEGGAIESVELKGDTQQTTYSGKNLFDVTRQSTWTGSNTTYSVSDGVLTVSGDWFVGIIANVVQGTQYYVSATRSDKSGASQAGNIAVYSGNTQLAFLGQNNGTFTAPSSNVTILFYSGAGSTGSCKFSEIQIEAGSEKTSYEPYVGGTASPNPDYPQEVQTVTGRQVVTITDGGSESQEYEINLGKNLCDGINQEYWLTSAATGAGVSSGNSGLIIPIEQNTSYTISTTSSQARYRVAFSDQTYQGSQFNCYNGANRDGTSDSITINSGNHKYLIVNATDLTKIQIEKGSSASTFAPYFTPIELCKIGTHQDYIYKSGEDWYVHKETWSYTFDGSSDEQWIRSGQSTPTNFIAGMVNLQNFAMIGGDANSGYCNYFDFSIYLDDNKVILSGYQSSGYRFLLYRFPSGSTVTDLASFTTWLGNNHLKMVLVLSTPTDTQITNATLISELEDLLSATTYSGSTYITVSGDLASPLEVVAEADSKLAPDSVYGAAIKDGAVSVDKIADLKALADALAPYLN